MSNDLSLQVRLDEIRDLNRIEEMWLDLQQRAAHSFFLSWGWMRTWLECLPEKNWPTLLIVVRGDRLVGLGLIGRNRNRRHGAIRSDGWHLNETGDDQLDHLTIEHNGILADSTCEREVVEACLNHLVQSNWDEFHLRAVNADSVLSKLCNQPPDPLEVRLVKESPCPFVDLTKLREPSADYLGLLSGNTRQQIRRAMRLYEEMGPLTVDAPQSTTEAMQFFQELKQLHQIHWQQLGEPGAFGFEFCDRFHQTLIARRWSEGEIQLLRIRSGQSLIGYLYNFVYHGRVSFYQSGMVYSDDPKLKPGLVCHVMAIEHNRNQGAEIYDFLAGSDRYKQSLSTNFGTLYWYVWQKPRWKFRVENWLRSAKRRLVSLTRMA